MSSSHVYAEKRKSHCCSKPRHISWWILVSTSLTSSVRTVCRIKERADILADPSIVYACDQHAILACAHSALTYVAIFWHFSSYVNWTGWWAHHSSAWWNSYSVFRAMSAIGELSENHSLNRRRREQSMIRREATKVSGQEMETQKRGNSARSGVATG